MNNLLIVYNTCGIRGNDSSYYYLLAINSILQQSFTDYKLVISGCCLPDTTKENLKIFEDKVDFNYIDDIYPVNVTFNHSCLAAIAKYGRFEGYLYMDSGCLFTDNNDLQKLWDGFKSHQDCGIYWAQTDTDNGYFLWFDLGKHTDDNSENYKLFLDGDYKIPVGKCCNSHVLIYSDSLVNFYGRPLTDIFAGYYTETVFCYLCAAIQQAMYINKDIIVHHEQNVDGQSSGYNPYQWLNKLNKPQHDHPYLVDSIMDIVNSPEANRLGLGYGEVRVPKLHPNGVVCHDPGQYDKNGYCINNLLKRYIKKYLFLPPELLDYNSIKGTL
jgi:hypothetical protein